MKHSHKSRSFYARILELLKSPSIVGALLARALGATASISEKRDSFTS